MPGPPFAFGAILVILALLVAVFIPDAQNHVPRSPTRRVAPVQLEMYPRDNSKQYHSCFLFAENKTLGDHC